MAMRLVIIALMCSGAASVALGKPSGSVDPKLSPIQKVVILLREMKAETVKQGDEDLEAYNKYMCWCETTEAEKTAAIKAAEEKIAELEAFLEGAAAKEGELKTEIAGLEEDIAADTEALKAATAMRKEENDKFLAEEADMKETLGLLSEAITVLSKVQLVQRPEAHKEALLQVSGIVHRVSSKFQNVMQKDLYDLFGEFQGLDQHRE